MMAPNPFAVVPTLYTFARDVARDLARHRRVLVIAGPYAPGQLVDVVRRLCGRITEDDVRVIESSGEIPGDDAPLVIARSFHLCRELILTGVCPGWYGSVYICPSGLTRTELRGFAFQVLADENDLSDAFRTMVIDFCCELCAGSLDVLVDALDICLERDYRPPHPFVHPRDVVRECAVRQEERTVRRLGKRIPLTTGRDETPAQVCVFREGLVKELGKPEPSCVDAPKPSARLAAMWRLNWSYGLCFTMDGVWCPGWDVLFQGESPWKPSKGGPREALSEVVACREAAAMQVGFIPVWERYKSQVLGRLADAGAGWGASTERYQDMSEFCQRVKGSQAFNQINETAVSPTLLRFLRNKVVHSNVDSTVSAEGYVGKGELATLGKVLAALEAQEANPDAPRYRRCFC